MSELQMNNHVNGYNRAGMHAELDRYGLAASSTYVRNNVLNKLEEIQVFREKTSTGEPHNPVLTRQITARFMDLVNSVRKGKTMSGPEVSILLRRLTTPRRGFVPLIAVIDGMQYVHSDPLGVKINPEKLETKALKSILAKQTSYVSDAIHVSDANLLKRMIWWHGGVSLHTLIAKGYIPEDTKTIDNDVVMAGKKYKTDELQALTKQIHASNSHLSPDAIKAAIQKATDEYHKLRFGG